MLTADNAMRSFLALELILVQLPASAPADSRPAEAARPRAGKSIDAAEVARLMDLLEAVGRETPRERFDPAALVKSLGGRPGVARLFAFVRDSTSLLPYRGSLRGSHGALLERRGNSLDRALLLGELLRIAGHRVRLVSGTLSAEQAKAVLATVPAARPAGLARETAAARQRMEEVFFRQAAKRRFDVARLRERMQAHRRRAAELTQYVAERVADQRTRLAAALGPIGGSADGKADALEALREHWWAQAHDGRAWVDLDPTLPDARPGRAIAAPTTAVPVKPAVRIDDALPAKYQHAVTVRLLIQQWTGGVLKTHAPLACRLVPSRLIGQPIFLLQMPTKWPKGAKALRPGAGFEAFKAVFLKQTQWTPELHVGDKVGFGKTFDAGGNLVAPRGGVGALAGALGGRTAPPKGHLTGAWVQYDISAPGRPVRTIHRELFDLLGPAARSNYRTALKAGLAVKLHEPKLAEAEKLERALSLADRLEILPVVSDLPPEFLQHLMTSSLLANRKAFAKMAAAPKGDPTAGLSEPLRPIPGNLYALAAMRWQWSRHRRSLYLASPNILTNHQRLRRTEGRRLGLPLAFDIVANDVAVLPGAGADAFAVRLEQGIVDTNAEAVLLSMRGPTKNTAELFAAAGARKIPWVLCREAKDVAKLKLPRDDLARIRGYITGGHAVLAPGEAMKLGDGERVAWWCVDRKTGQTLGIGPHGWGISEPTILQSSARVRGEGHAEYMIIMAMIIGPPGFAHIFDQVFGPGNWVSECITDAWEAVQDGMMEAMDWFIDLAPDRRCRCRNCLLVEAGRLRPVEEERQ